MLTVLISVELDVNITLDDCKNKEHCRAVGAPALILPNLSHSKVCFEILWSSQQGAGTAELRQVSPSSPFPHLVINHTLSLQSTLQSLFRGNSAGDLAVSVQ